MSVHHFGWVLFFCEGERKMLFPVCMHGTIIMQFKAGDNDDFKL